MTVLSGADLDPPRGSDDTQRFDPNKTPTGPPFIWLPPPPPHWHRIRVRTIHDVVVIFVGTFLLMSQAIANFLWERKPEYWIIVAGLTCLGYEWAVRRDRRAHDHDESH